MEISMEQGKDGIRVQEEWESRWVFHNHYSILSIFLLMRISRVLNHFKRR